MRSEDHRHRFRAGRELWIPLLLFCLLAAGAYGLKREIEAQEQSRIQIETEVTARQVGRRIENWIGSRTLVLYHLADEFYLEHAGSLALFSSEAAKFVKENTGFQAINWIDPNWVIRIIIPEKGNEPARGEDLRLLPSDGVAEAISRAERTGKIARTPTIDLPQGGKGFATYLPVYGQGKTLSGFINGVFNVDKLINMVVDEPSLRSQFCFDIFDEDGELVYRHRALDSPHQLEYAVSVPVRIVDREWTLRFAPSPEFLARTNTTAGEILFGAGLIIALLLSGLIRILLARQKALHLSEERFRSLSGDVLENLRVGIIILDKDLKIVWVNEAIERYFGVARDELLGQDKRQLVREKLKFIFEDPDRYAGRVIKAYDNNTFIENFECRVLPGKERKGRWLELRSQPVLSGLYAGGRIEHYYGITERKEAELSLHESEEKLRLVFEKATDGILLADIVTKNLSAANEAICRMLGYTRDEFMEMTVSDLHPEESRSFVLEQFEKQTRHEVLTAKDIPVKRKDGSIFYADISSGPVLIGSRTYLLGHFRDVTDRKEFEEAILASRRDWESIFQAIGHPSMVIDADQNIIAVNRAMVEVSSLSERQITALKCYQVCDGPGAEEPPENCPHRNILQAEHPGTEEGEMEMFGGTYLVSMTPVFNEDNRLEKVIHIATDITERKALEERLRQAQKMEAIGILAGGVAHDFNNILMPIMGYVDMALAGIGETHQAHKFLAKVQTAASRAQGITNQLLAFSRKQVMKLEVLDLNFEVRETTSMLRRMIGEDIEFTVLLEENLPNIKADSGQIQQVLMNLAINARDAMISGGALILETGKTKKDDDLFRQYPEAGSTKFVTLSVTDTGTGISPEVMEHIYEPFFTTKDRERGTGLGLSTVFGIVSQHNGFITVSSTPGSGTTFRIYLPAADEQVPEKREHDMNELITDRHETILIVEDNDMVRELTASMLESLGYDVLSAALPEEALTIINTFEGEIDLLLSDMVMPQMSGQELYRKITSGGRVLRVLFMSGYTENIISRGLEGDRFIQKPFNIKELALKVKEALYN